MSHFVRMTSTSLKELTAFVALAGTIGTVLAFFGIRFVTPRDDLDNHIAASVAVHEELQEADALHDSLVAMQQSASEAVLVRICVRDAYEELMAQRMLPLCESLGVPRRPGDMGAREAVEAGAPLPAVTVDDSVP